MMKRLKSTTPQAGQGGEGVGRVDILHLEISQPEENTETISIYGFVHGPSGQIAGFTMSCTVHWQVEDYSLDSGDAYARSYFSNLVASHADSQLLSPDAAIEMTFTDPEIKEPIGFGSGYLKIQGGFLN